MRLLSNSSSQCLFSRHSIPDCRVFSSSTWTMVAIRQSLFRQNNLPKLVTARSESSRTGEQVILPHAPETLIVVIFQLRPGALKILVPGHQGFVIIETEIVPIFQNEIPFKTAAYLLGGWNHPVRENVLVNPGIGSFRRRISADGVQKKKPIVLQ